MNVVRLHKSETSALTSRPLGATEYVKSDLYRIAGSCNMKSFVWNILTNRGFIYMFWFRLASRSRGLIWPLAVWMHRHLSLKYGIQIPRRTQIGFGLYIGHHMGVVIHPSARIGNNCNVSQFTTIGSNHGMAAEIGDEVYLGPSVCVVEDVSIGRGACIGAGAVVVKDIPPYTTAVGVPASVVSHQPPAHIQNPWTVRA